MAFQKTVCPVNREQFLASAKGLTLRVEGTDVLEESLLEMRPRSFSSGSFGYNYSGKLTVYIDGIPCKVQASINLTLVGSKPNGDTA